ncbi:hypothetical protein RDV64_05115 [Acuticoccus sp. MNP-M23]|nr:hypothetical protein [Acuticoccus sp. MNP-M23]WMS43781.1 hypothetical protein RDV64_05115 [Acuticoccus sp. MNP-M23]
MKIYALVALYGFALACAAQVYAARLSVAGASEFLVMCTTAIASLTGVAD